jgi:hypothetical protein
MEELRCSYKFFAGKTEGSRLPRRKYVPRLRWYDNIKMDIKEKR